MADWLADHAGKGTRIGYDPWLHTRQWVEEATQALAESGATLVAVESNPIDAVWADRPQPSDAKLTVQPDVAAGKSSAQKRQEIADWLAAKKATAVVLSALASTAVALTVRAREFSTTPVSLSSALFSPACPP